MKFGEMSTEQQEAFREALLTVTSVKSQEEQRYTEQFFRLLVLGNGTGVFLLAAFMGALVTTNKGIGSLRMPLILFSVGAFLAALVYVPLMGVANQATINAFQQITDFFLNKKILNRSSPTDSMQGVGMSSSPCSFHPYWPSELPRFFAFVF